MAKDGTMRGGARVGSGRKSKALTEKIDSGQQGGGFEIAKRVVCYGGKDRYILVKDRRKKE